MDDLTQEARAAAFRLLLETGRPVSAARIAAEIKSDPGAVEAALRQVEQAGRIRRSPDGQVLGSAGLSVVPAAHELWLGSRRWWTWCAFDIVGIVGALQADAHSLSRSPASGAEVRLRFEAGHPPDTAVALLLPDDRGRHRTIDDWCANANFFENRKAALAWSAEHKLGGEVVDLEEGRRRGLEHWTPLLRASAGQASGA